MYPWFKRKQKYALKSQSQIKTYLNSNVPYYTFWIDTSFLNWKWASWQLWQHPTGRSPMHSLALSCPSCHDGCPPVTSPASTAWWPDEYSSPPHWAFPRTAVGRSSCRTFSSWFELRRCWPRAPCLGKQTVRVTRYTRRYRRFQQRRQDRYPQCKYRHPNKYISN